MNYKHLFPYSSPQLSKNKNGYYATFSQKKNVTQEPLNNFISNDCSQTLVNNSLICSDLHSGCISTIQHTFFLG